MERHLVLVGLPGAGKTAVGSVVAGMLGVLAHDIDEALEREQHCSVADLIAERGESEFRRLESQEMERVL